MSLSKDDLTILCQNDLAVLNRKTINPLLTAI